MPTICPGPSLRKQVKKRLKSAFLMGQAACAFVFVATGKANNIVALVGMCLVGLSLSGLFIGSCLAIFEKQSRVYAFCRMLEYGVVSLRMRGRPRPPHPLPFLSPRPSGSSIPRSGTSPTSSATSSSSRSCSCWRPTRASCT